MKKHISKIAAIIVSLTVAASVAYAANVHFKRTPNFTDNGTTLTGCFSLSGLGNQDVTITIDTRGDASTQCINPGGTAAPGINKKNLGGSGSQTFSANEIKNGTLSACVTTGAPTITAKEAGCPNDGWTAVITDVKFNTATITVTQGGQIVLQTTQTF